MIYVFCDHEVDWKWNRDNIGKALSLSENDNVGCFYSGDDESIITNQLTKLGVKKMIYCSVPMNGTYLSYTQFICGICKTENPELVIFPGSNLGRAVAATCAILLEAGLVADCIDVSKDYDGSYIFSRTALNSSVVAHISGINHRMMMCTTKQNVFPFKVEYTMRTTTSLCMTRTSLDVLPKLFDFGYEIIQSIKYEQATHKDLLTAPIVFSVGRGVSQQNIDKLWKISQQCGVALGCTRAVVEAGGLPKTMQIGQSGKVIAPKLLILLGVSGASQHIAGFVNAKKVISINIDENAPIRNFCDIVITVDANELITLLFNYLGGSRI